MLLASITQSLTDAVSNHGVWAALGQQDQIAVLGPGETALRRIPLGAHATVEPGDRPTDLPPGRRPRCADR